MRAQTAHAQIDASFPWHSGEVEVQQRLGVAERMAKNGSRVVRDYMPNQHRDFYGSIPFMMIGSVDPAGDVWASMVTGKPGFMNSPSPTELDIDFIPDATDPAAVGLRNGDAIGMLGIELSTRRRNRMNGFVHDAGEEAFSVSVGHSFGNCPQYIQLRDFEFVRDANAPFDHHVEELAELDDAARAMIAGADTFFVASYVDAAGPDSTVERQVDVSHRGGKPGFVRVDAKGRMTIPDFAGNLHYNTLGNLTVNPRAGLIFTDFETGDVLQITGTTEIDYDSPEIAHFRGAERLWHFTPTRVVRRKAALPIRWKLQKGDAFSPNSLMTGSWEDTAAKIEAETIAKTWRAFRIARIVEETAEIRSFYLEPTDGKGIPNFEAGQHLPVRAALNEGDRPESRIYTLSAAPSDGFYRISVKKQGAFSAWLYARAVGDTLEARGPQGAFHITGTEDRAAVLIAAGVGVTPMLSMLRQIVFEGKRRRGTRPTWIIHVDRSRQSRAFHEEIGELVREAEGAVRYIVVHSQPGSREQEGIDYSYTGRFSAADFARFLPFGDYDFYLCGPGGFMQSTYDGLRAMGVVDARVHSEAFGPSSLKREADVGNVKPVIPASADSVPVLFAASSKEARWEPESGTLLDLAEKRGLTPEFSCRGGSCGSCAVKLLKGAITYPDGVSFETEKDEILLCSAVPAAGSETLEIEA
ncbi:2Fe-2S iron-sulfur cluster-binding protein [Erythrobacter sp. Alg231-14]|uniref:2Fe-2S iron-sulfur cluster-binding protein n=1 Tax=Erythrobacter sp. Alg231-14 TaxID=1922225 RepID=UPI000D56123E